MLALRLPESIEQRLGILAERTGRSKSFYAREAILTHISDLEDIYLAEATLEKVRRGEERIYSSDEMEKLLELDN